MSGRLVLFGQKTLMRMKCTTRRLVTRAGATQISPMAHFHRTSACAQPCSDDSRQGPDRQIGRSYFCPPKSMCVILSITFVKMTFVQKECHDRIKYHAAATRYCQYLMTMHENN